MSPIALLIARLAAGDIPPPPPDIPGTGIPLPQPLHLVVAGILLSAAIVALMRPFSAEAPQKLGWAVAVGAIALLTLGGTLYSLMEHAAYNRMRRNWRGSGPIRQLEPPVRRERLEDLQPPVEDVEAAADSSAPPS